MRFVPADPCAHVRRHMRYPPFRHTIRLEVLRSKSTLQGRTMRLPDLRNYRKSMEAGSPVGLSCASNYSSGALSGKNRSTVSGSMMPVLSDPPRADLHTSPAQYKMSLGFSRNSPPESSISPRSLEIAGRPKGKAESSCANRAFGQRKKANLSCKNDLASSWE